MYKFIMRMLLVAAICLPWATMAQNDCTHYITQSQPIFEDFEGVAGTTYSTAGSLPSCWDGYTNGTTVGYTPHVVGSGTYWYTHSGSKALGMTSGSGTTYGNTKYVFLPPVDVPLNQLELSFWMCTESSSNGTLAVGYVTSNDTSTFTAIQSFPASSETYHSGTGLQATAGAVYTVALSNVPTTATRIAFRWYFNSTFYSCFIDDVFLGYTPTCPTPSDVTASNVTANSVTLSWTRGGTENAWMITIGEDVYYPTDTFYMVNNLDGNTQYTAKVHAICGYNDTSLFSSCTFRTTCVPITSLPYTNDFEDEPAYSSSSVPYADAFPNCWTRINDATGNYNYYPYINTSTTYLINGSKSMYWYLGTGTDYADNQYAVLPPVDLSVYDISDLTLAFYARTTATAAPWPLFIVGVMSDVSDQTTFVPVDTIELTNTATLYAVSLAGYTGTGNFIAIRSPRTTAARYCSLDDVILADEWCDLPGNVTATATTDQVTLSWDANGGTSFTIFLGDDTLSSITSTTYTFTNLSPDTEYEYGVARECSSGNSEFIVGSVHTECVPISNFPYSEDFENYGSGATQPIGYCWTKGTNSSTAYPYPYSTAAINGSRGLYFYSNRASTATATSYYSWAAMPPVDDNVQMNTLMVNFNAKRYSSTSASYHSMIVVGIADSVTGFNSAAALDTTVTWLDTIDLTPEEPSSIHAVEVSFENYTGTGKYVVFYAPLQVFVQGTAQPNYIYLDDIVLREIPSCFWPTDVYTVSVGSDEATIAWTPDPRTHNPNSWTVEYVEHGLSLEDGYTETANDTVVTLSNLLPNTEYDVYIKANCGSDVSETATHSFRTACEAFDSLPYSENFDSYTSGWGNTPNCWNFLNLSSSSSTYPQAYTYATTTYAVSGNCLYFKSSSTTPVYAVLPAINADLNTLQISFTYRNEGVTAANGTLSLGYMTNPVVDTTFVEVATFEQINAITSVEFDFSDYEIESGNYNIAFRYTGGTASNYYLGIDNVVVDVLPSCRRSTSLTVDSLSYDYARLTWQNSSSSVDNYIVYYSTQPVFAFDTCPSVVVYDTVVVLTNLPSETDYYWTVVANCGSGDSSLVPAIQYFRTLLDCGDDYINIIDTIGDATTTGYTYFAYNYTSYAKGYSANIFTAEEMMNMGIMTTAEIHSVSVHAGTTACTIPNMKVYAAYIDTNAFSGAVDTNLFASMTLLYDGSITTTANEWVTINFDTTFHYDGSSNLMLLFRRTGAPSANGTFYYTTTTPVYSTLYGYASSATGTPTATRSYLRVNMMFNMCAEVPTCRRPMEINVVDLVDTVATIAWETVEGTYEYVFGAPGFDPDNATAISTADTFVVLNGLTQNTHYDFYVRTICDPSLVSDWSVATHILTPCAAQPLPYSEDFESYGSGSSESISPCWVKGTSSTTGYPYPYSTNVVSGSRSLYFYGYYPSSATSTPIYSYAALPMFAAPVNNLMVSFKLRRYGTTTAYYTSRMLVGVMSDPEDISTFVGIDTIDLRDEPGGSIHQFEVPFDSYTGTGKYITFYDAVPPLYGTNTYAYSYVSLDDIVVDYIPSCRRVLDINVDSTSQNTAIISWTYPTVPANGYEIEYGPQGFALGTGTTLTTLTNTVTLAGLSASTSYDFYIRAYCSATETSPWSFTTNFRTSCGIYNVPFFEDFESYASGSGNPIDPCWTKGTSSSTAYPYPYTTNAVSGSISLYFYGYYPSSSSSTPIYSYVALPEFNAPVDSLELSFKVRRYATTTDYYTTRLLVGVMTDPNDISTFVGVDTIDLKNELGGSIHDITVSFDGYTGTGNHIAIYDAVPPLYGTSTYCYSYAYVDDISVNKISPCGHPFDLGASVTNNTITLEWTDTVGATSWQIEYGPTGFQLGTGTTITVNTNPYTITGLNPSTLYDIYVRSMCTSGALGGTNNGIFTVSTSQVPATVPYYYDFEAAAEWSNWQTASNNSVSWYRGTAEAAEGNYGLYVSADNGVTCNSLHATITNSAVYRDIDFGDTVSSFEVTFLAKSAGVSDGNYEGINVMLVDPSVPVSASSTALTTPWGTFNVVHVVRDTIWHEHTLLFDNVSGVKRLVFNWYTSTTSTHPVWEGAGAIDSLVVVEQSCARPINTTVTDVGPDYVSLTWDGPANANYVVRLRDVDDTTNTNIDNVTNTNSYVVSNLSPMTTYYVWVYHVCDSNNISYSAPRITFTTTCTLISAVDTLWEDFDSITGTAYSTAGVLPDCWEGYSNGTSAGYWPHVTNGSTYSYSVTGNAITMTSGSTATYGNTKIVRLPKFVEPISTMTMSYWYCTESSSIGKLYVGYMTGFDYENDFVPLVEHPASQASYHSGNGPQTAGHGVFDTISFDTVPSNALFIAFKWYQDGTFCSVCIDNVQVTSTGNYCATPVALPASDVTYNSATINWSSNASDFEVAVKAANEAIWPDETAVSAHSYAVTGLTQATVYQYRVRALCNTEEGLISDWTVGTFTTDSLPCIAPSNLQNTDVSFSTATFDWTPNGDETAWRIIVWNTGTQPIVYNAVEHPVTVTGLAQSTEYFATVTAACGYMIESETSDTISFTTATCQPVTNVAVSNIAQTTATVSWNGDAASYSIEYGLGDFEQGNGTSVDNITTTTYNITGLQADRNYSVYVRANCDANNPSAWSQRVQFRTLAPIGIDDVNGVNVAIYPNPTSDNTTIALSGVTGEVTITIVDLSGRTWYAGSLACDGGCVHAIDVTGLAEGAYFVRVNGEGVNMVKKLVVK